jgi:hypothetical protein
MNNKLPLKDVGGFSSQKQRILIVFAFTFFFGLFLYFPLLSGWLTNPDGVWMGLFLKNDYSWENALGRIGLQFLAKFKGYFIFPSFQLLFNLLLMSGIAVLFNKIFEINSLVLNLVSGVFLMASPTLVSTLTYHYTSDAYILAYFLAVFSVYLVIDANRQLKSFRKLIRFIFAVGCLIFSLSCYQAYIGTVITIMIVYVLYFLLCTDKDRRNILRNTVIMAAITLISTLGYLVVFRIYCFIFHVQPVADRGFSQMGQIPFSQLPQLILKAYQSFYHYFFTDQWFNNSWHWRTELNFLCFLIIGIMMIRLILIKKIYNRAVEFWTIIFLLLILPIGFMNIVILAPEYKLREDVTGILTIPQMNYIYIFMCYLLGNKIVFAANWKNHLSTLFQKASLFVSAMIMIVLCLYIQVYQRCMGLDLRAAYSLAQRIIVQIESLPEYEPAMPLLVEGRAEDGNYPRLYPELYYVIKGTTAEHGYFWDSMNGRENCWIQFLAQYMGVKFEACNNDTILNIIDLPEYAEMPIFPTEGSVEIIQNVIVVKLSRY